jgi:hypothetical protein
VTFGALVLLLFVAAVVVERRGLRGLGILLQIASYAAAIVWAFIGTPVTLLLMVAAPLPALFQRARRRGQRARAAALAMACAALVASALTLFALA